MINAYLVDPITVVRHGGFDKYNDPLPTIDEPTIGYVEWGSRVVNNIAGEQELAVARILMKYDPTLNHEDKIEVDGKTYSIIAIFPAKDFGNKGMWVSIN